MDGFKDSTRMKYMTGGPVKKAMGGVVPATPSPAATATAAKPAVGPGMSATATAAKPAVGPGMSATTQGTDAERRAHNAQAILQAKYSSATPNKDASNRTQQTTNAAGNVTSNKVVNQFDRNQAARDFTSVSSNFLKQGVPLKELTRASGELRKLQLDNSSTPAQHQAAIQSVLARMNSLVPKKVAKGGAIKMSKGGTFNEKGKRATLAEMEAEDRRMAGRASEGVSSRPTDSSGRRASNADLGMTASAKPAMKKGVPSYSGKPMIRRKTGGLAVMPKGKC